MNRSIKLDTIAANIKRLRRSRKLSRPQLAERSGVSVSMIKIIESNRANISINTLDKIAKGLSADISELMGS